MASAELLRRGWHLTEKSITELDTNEKGNIVNIVKKTLDADLNDIGEKWLDEDINKDKIDYVKGPGVLQLQKLRDISSPSDNEYPQEIPSICLFTLTDGHISCSAVTLEPIKELRLNTPPGSKVLLSGTVEVQANFLLLSNKNTRFLGGRVESLAGPWELKRRSLAKELETSAIVREDRGPPPFVPFGQNIASDLLLSLKKDNFVSLRKNKEKKSTVEDVQFQQQRQTAVKEAVQTKIAKENINAYGGVKYVYGGVKYVYGGERYQYGGDKYASGGEKFLNHDRDLARIMEMGFSPAVAAHALKTANGHGNHALNNLLAGRQRYQENVNKQKLGSTELNKPSNVKTPLSSDLLLTSNRDNTADRPNGCNPSVHGPPQTSTNLQHKHGLQVNQGKGESHSTYYKQQQQQSSISQYVSTRQREGAEGPLTNDKEGRTDAEVESSTNKSCGISILKESSVKENSLNQVTQAHLESNHNQTVNNNQHAETHKSQAQELQTSFNVKCNTGHKMVPNSKDEGAYRTKSGDSNQQSHINHQYRNSDQRDRRNYVSNSHNQGQFGNRSYNDRSLLGLYQHQPFQQYHFTPTLARQDFSNKQLNLHGNLPLSVGTRCLAKYWEDQLFHPAVVTAVNEGGRSLVVEFLGYGNIEQVDITEIQLQTHPASYSMLGINPFFPGSAPFSEAPPFDFNTSGNFHDRSYSEGRHYNNQIRPTQEYYQPPKSRYH